MMLDWLTSLMPHLILAPILLPMFTAAVMLLLREEHLRIKVVLNIASTAIGLCIAVALLSYAVNLFIFSMGRQGLAIDKEPVLRAGVPQDLAHYADPMPQALVLTAIVIGFAMTALFLVVLLASRGTTATDHVDGAHSRTEQEMP